MDLRRFLFKMGKSDVDDAGEPDAGEPGGDEASPQELTKLRELLGKLGIAEDS